VQAGGEYQVQGQSKKNSDPLLSIESFLKYFLEGHLEKCSRFLIFMISLSDLEN